MASTKYIFGANFLKSYYTIYDHQNMRVGISLAINSTVAVIPKEEDNSYWFIVALLVIFFILVVVLLVFNRQRKSRPIQPTDNQTERMMNQATTDPRDEELDFAEDKKEKPKKYAINFSDSTLNRDDS